MIRRILTLCLALAVSMPLWGDEEALTLNLNNADIRALISTVSEMTGKNFIVDPRVKGKVTVISASPSSRDHIYEIFLSILKVHGFAAVPSGDVIKILPNTQAKQESIRTLTPDKSGERDEPITRVIEVKHVNASQLVPILRPLMPQQAHLAVHADTNTLIVADTVANVSRIVDIIHRIDRVSEGGVEVIPLQNANATELVQVLNALKQAGPKGGAGEQKVTLVADPRTNSILLGGNPNRRLELLALVAHLDTPIANEGNTEVIYLRYAQAKNLVEVLKGIGTHQAEAEGKAQKGGSAKKEFDIQADEATNALVITAPPMLMRSLKTVINQLDIRRAQVYIEAVIAELLNDKALDYGVEWETGRPNDGFYGSSFSASVSPGLATGTAGFNLGFYDNGKLKGLIKAMAKDSDTNVLSTPSLLTLDNEEATIHVGQNIPFVTGSYSNTSSGSNSNVNNPFQTIERHDVGIKLKVSPQINEGDTIKLKIEQEISGVAEGVEGSSDLVTNKRTIETTILVDDGQTIVLGGLMENKLIEAVSKIPLVGDIPIIGNLFKSTGSTLNKTNLMVFLRPQIIRDERTAMRLTNSKYNYIRDLEQKVEQVSTQPIPGLELMPDKETPVLPPLPPAGEEAPPAEAQ